MIWRPCFCSHNNTSTLDDKSKPNNDEKKLPRIWSLRWRRTTMDKDLMKNTIRHYQTPRDLGDGDRRRENWDTTFHCRGSVSGALRCGCRKWNGWRRGDRRNRSGRYRVEWNIIIRKLNKWESFSAAPRGPLLKRATACGSTLTTKDSREHKTNLDAIQSWIYKSWIRGEDRIVSMKDTSSTWQEWCNYIWASNKNSHACNDLSCWCSLKLEAKHQLFNLAWKSRVILLFPFSTHMWWHDSVWLAMSAQHDNSIIQGYLAGGARAWGCKTVDNGFVSFPSFKLFLCIFFFWKTKITLTGLGTK